MSQQIVRFEEMLTEVIPAVPACPDNVIITSLRAATIDFCEKTYAYNQMVEYNTSIVNIAEYELNPPHCTAVEKIIHMSYNGEAIEPLSNQLIEERLADWRENNGTPQYYAKQQGNRVILAPRPSRQILAGIITRCALKPTHDAPGIETWFYNDYREDMVNGCLFRLLRMPTKEWSDVRSASIYAGLYAEGIQAAERKGRQADTGVARKTRYAGAGSSYIRGFNRSYGSRR